MKAYICDACKKQEAPNGIYETPPKDWWSLSQSGSTTLGTLTFCSALCLIAFLKASEKIAADKAATEEPAHA